VTVTLIYIILLAGLVLSRGRLVQGVAHG